jgi:NAD(P)H-hydrate epimerase
MREIDRLATAAFGIDLLQMVEQAGSHLAELVRVELGGRLEGRSIVVAVGPGNNGAGGLAAARHLANRGAAVRVVLARPVIRLPEASRHQLDTLLEMAVDCCVAIFDLPDDDLDAVLASADVVVDAVLGYGGHGEPHADVGWLIGRIAESGRPIVSLDIPSGVDADTGEAPGAAVAASATLTVALPKEGLLAPGARDRVGRLFLADIGLPRALLARVGIDASGLFAAGRIVRLDLGSLA